MISVRRARVAGSTAVVERPYSVDTPLNRVVDYIDPASEWVARFSAAVRALIDESADAEDKRLVADAATRWRRQRDLVQRLGARIPAIAELDAISQKLAVLADVIDAASNDTITDQHRASVAQAKDPVRELLIAVVPVIQEWLDA